MTDLVAALDSLPASPLSRVTIFASADFTALGSELSTLEIDWIALSASEQALSLPPVDEPSDELLEPPLAALGALDGAEAEEEAEDELPPAAFGLALMLSLQPAAVSASAPQRAIAATPREEM